MKGNKEIFNIDELVLSIPCDRELYNQFASMPVETVYDNYNDFTLKCMQKEGDIDDPDVFYLSVNFNDGKLFGVFKCEKEKGKATLAINKEMFYEVLTVTNNQKVNMLPLIEYICDSIGFDLTKATIDQLRIVRDSKFNTLKVLSMINSNPNYDLYLNDLKQEMPVHLIDKYFIGEEGLTGKRFSRLHKQNVFNSNNILGNLEVMAYEKSQEIHNVSHEYFILQFDGFEEDEKFYRTEINLLKPTTQLKNFYQEKDIEDHGYYTLCEFFESEKLKDLFNWLSRKLIYFKNKATGEIVII